MVKLSKLYTKTGDDGTTGLVGGDRIAKDSPCMTAIGDVDELNSILGMCRTYAEAAHHGPFTAQLSRIQNTLFDLGSELATPPGKGWQGMVTIKQTHVAELEVWIDEATARLPELKSFVLPGGTLMNSALHSARCVCRRAERSVIALHANTPVSQELRMYLNRLSDLLFAMAREAAVLENKPEYLWKPGG